MGEKESFDSTDSSAENSTEADVGGTDISEGGLDSSVAEIMALVDPILQQLFKAAAENDDYWMKSKTVSILADWIVSVLNVSQLMEQQVRALGASLQAQEKELEQLRPEKSKMWTPGV